MYAENNKVQRPAVARTVALGIPGCAQLKAKHAGCFESHTGRAHVPSMVAQMICDVHTPFAGQGEARTPIPLCDITCRAAVFSARALRRSSTPRRMQPQLAALVGIISITMGIRIALLPAKQCGGHGLLAQALAAHAEVCTNTLPPSASARAAWSIQRCNGNISGGKDARVCWGSIGTA